MSAPTKGKIEGNYRMQIYNADEAADVAKALEIIENKVGAKLSQSQFLVILARTFLKAN